MTSPQSKSTRPKCPQGKGAEILLTLSNTDTNECVLWPYHCMKNGYGQVSLNGRVMTTNRAAWIANGQEIKKGEDVCHSCDNRPCINLRHLFSGSRADNMEDCRKKGRNFIPCGEKCGGAVLTEEQVREIRAIYRPKTRGLGCRTLARRYGVGETAISSVIRGTSWRHLL